MCFNLTRFVHKNRIQDISYLFPLSNKFRCCNEHIKVSYILHILKLSGARYDSFLLGNEWLDDCELETHCTAVRGRPLMQ